MSRGYDVLRVYVPGGIWPRGYLSKGDNPVGIRPWDKCPGVHGWGFCFVTVMVHRTWPTGSKMTTYFDFCQNTSLVASVVYIPK